MTRQRARVLPPSARTAAPSRHTLVSRPSARLGADFTLGVVARASRDPGATRRAASARISRFALLALGPGSRGVYPRAARSADPGARPGHERWMHDSANRPVSPAERVPRRAFLRRLRELLRL